MTGFCIEPQQQCYKRLQVYMLINPQPKNKLEALQENILKDTADQFACLFNASCFYCINWRHKWTRKAIKALLKYAG